MGRGPQCTTATAAAAQLGPCPYTASCKTHYRGLGSKNYLGMVKCMLVSSNTKPEFLERRGKPTKCQHLTGQPLQQQQVVFSCKSHVVAQHSCASSSSSKQGIS